MQEYCEEVQRVDTEETRLAGSESVAGVSQCTQHTPQLRGDGFPCPVRVTNHYPQCSWDTSGPKCFCFQSIREKEFNTWIRSQIICFQFMNPVLKGRLLQGALSGFILICGAAMVGEMFMLGTDKHALSSFPEERNFSFSSWHSNLFPIISVPNNLSLSLLLISSIAMCLHKSNTIHQTKAVGVRGLDLAFQGCDSQLSSNTVFITFPRLITVASKTST